MESLYRKYRPQTFDDVVGQQHVVETLEHAVGEGRTSHAYLFCGPRGTGKTTMARLLAKALMCEQGPSRLPDGTCEQCQLIAHGEHPDVYELDAASRTGVDNVREEIIGRVGYAPVQARYKVYIIDEVHMLTVAAFNALLKTLEEPPEHVVFVLCTTDPQKIPATILSRVQRFDFRPISNEDIQRRLAYVCEQEGFSYEDEALELVVRSARGGMRDALSTLEQLSVFGSGTISLASAKDMLGSIPGADLDEIVDGLARRDVSLLFAKVGALVDSGRDLLTFTRELAVRIRDLYVTTIAGVTAVILPTGSDSELLERQARAFGSADRLARVLTLLGDVSREMSYTPNQRLALEICFTRVARPESDLTLEALAERVAALETRSAQVVTQQVAAVPVQQEKSVVASPSQAEDLPCPTHEGREGTSEPAAVRQPIQSSQPKRATASPVVQAGPVEEKPMARGDTRQSRHAVASGDASPTPAAPAITDLGSLQRMWRQVCGEILRRNPPRGTLLASSVAEGDDGRVLTIALPKGSVFALKMLDRADVRSLVEGVVREVFGDRSLKFKDGVSQASASVTKDTPAPAAPPSGTGASRQSSVSSAPQQSVTPSPAPVPAGSQAYGQKGASHVAQRPQEAPKPAKSSYPMPWDEPEPAQVPSVAPANEPMPGASDDDRVPYEDLDYAGYDDGMAGFEPAAELSKLDAPDAEAEPSKQVGAVFGRAPKTQAPAEPVQADVAQGMPEPVESGSAKAEPVTDPYEDLPPELLTILENAFEVFGSDVQSTLTQ